MNKQGPTGIEWTDYTWNVIGGCKHACRWVMPDGTTAVCYAESVAQGVASAAYPQGFAHHYWHPARLEEPLRLKEPAKIFLDSMSDIMGAWVPDEQIRAVLDVVRRADWHTFQLLTKNAPRLLKFKGEFPPNLWVGVSMPPTQMFGRTLTQEQQSAMLRKSLGVLAELEFWCRTRWMSFEPLSWDVTLDVCANWPIEWAVIGAASRGNQYYQPDAGWTGRLLISLSDEDIPVFFKGNLKWSPWRQEFPVQAKLTQGRLL